MKYNSISDDIYEYGYKITFSDYFTDVQEEKNIVHIPVSMLSIIWS